MNLKNNQLPQLDWKEGDKIYCNGDGYTYVGNNEWVLTATTDIAKAIAETYFTNPAEEDTPPKKIWRTLNKPWAWIKIFLIFFFLFLSWLLG